MCRFGPNCTGELRRESFRFYRVGLFWKTVPRETASCAIRAQISLFLVHILPRTFQAKLFPQNFIELVNPESVQQRLIGSFPRISS
jgi:hypothetical protein